MKGVMVFLILIMAATVGFLVDKEQVRQAMEWVAQPVAASTTEPSTVVIEKLDYEVDFIKIEWPGKIVFSYVARITDYKNEMVCYISRDGVSCVNNR